MSSEYQTTETLDVKGQSCPMPTVKAKQGIDGLEAGDVLEEPADVDRVPGDDAAVFSSGIVELS